MRIFFLSNFVNIKNVLNKIEKYKMVVYTTMDINKEIKNKDK